MCTVVNKYKHPNYDVYIGRGSIWGNPFVMKDESQRTKVIELYREHLDHLIQSNRVTLEMLVELDGKTLACFCKPNACHGDVIVEAVQWAKEELAKNK